MSALFTSFCWNSALMKLKVKNTKIPAKIVTFMEPCFRRDDNVNRQVRVNMCSFFVEYRVGRIVIFGLQLVKIYVVNAAAVDNQAIAQNNRFFA